MFPSLVGDTYWQSLFDSYSAVSLDPLAGRGGGNIYRMEESLAHSAAIDQDWNNVRGSNLKRGQFNLFILFYLLNLPAAHPWV